MASESKKRKAFAHSMCLNGAMKWDQKIKRVAMYHKRHRLQIKRDTAKEFSRIEV